MEIVFATDKQELSMLSYLKRFDPVEKKYALKDTVLSAKAYRVAAEAEKDQQLGYMTKSSFGDIAANLRLVYGDSDIIRKDIEAFFRVEDSIINRYLAIPQLDKLYDEDYFSFEWDMHVGQNYNEHKSDYYRDHFAHEIRDMYMMLCLLDEKETGFYEASKALLSDPEISKISQFTYKKWRQFAGGSAPEQTEVLWRVFKSQSTSEPFEAYKETYFFRYVIYASAVLSALFHDMGYPICHFLNVRDRVSAYNPFMYMFTHNAMESYDLLAAKLSASLLFTIVSPKELQASLQPNHKGRYNHGAYSAIGFLLRYYDGGLIYSLSPEKQCAIELAAIAIYNHTAMYDCIELSNFTDKPKSNYYTMVFRQNPISFLLRFCDDLQEWDRRYFEISDASDLIFCPNCGAPLMRQGRDKETVYRCQCNKSFPRPVSFPKRKLYLVSVADKVSIKLDTSEERDDNRSLIAEISYDYYKLLLLTSINPTYAKHRDKELYELKKLIGSQYYHFQIDKLPFQNIKLNYFMSANPLLIKIKIIEKAIEHDSLVDKSSTNSIKKKLKEKMESIKFPSKFRERYSAFYAGLFRSCRSQDKKQLNKIKNKYTQNTDIYYNEALCCLMDDCFEQYKRVADSSEYITPYIKPEDEGKFYISVKYFVNQVSICNQYEISNFEQYISHYFDLQLFYRLNDNIG